MGRYGGREVGKGTYQHVVPEGVALPGVPEVVFAQDAVDLHVSPWVVDRVDGEAEEV